MGIERGLGDRERAGFCLGLVALRGCGDLFVLAVGVYGLDGPAWNGRSVARKARGWEGEGIICFGVEGLVIGALRIPVMSGSIKSSRGEHTCH
jgi:hypothetical protein